MIKRRTIWQILLLFLLVQSTLFAASTLHILNADRFDALEGDRYRLRGNVHLQIVDEDGEEGTTVRSDELIVDLNTKSVSALGSVRSEGVKEISGEIITFFYEEGDITASFSDLVTETDDLSEQTVTLHTLGSLITYLSSQSVISYTNAQVGTRAEDPLSSIRAKHLTVLKDGDIMAKQVTLSIGRVPLFWAPFLFIPGARMMGNPAIGFASDRGMFLNTTWEIFGSYPAIKASEERTISNLLASKESEDQRPSWPIYQEGGTPSALQEWAKSSDSYLAILGDAYQERGLRLGYDGHVASSIFTLDSAATLLLDPDGLEEPTDVGRIRSWGRHVIGIKSKPVNLSLTLPHMSDPSVKSITDSRLHGFRLDSLFGSEQEFPTIAGDQNSYTTSITGSIHLPTTYTTPYLSSLSVSNISLQGTYRWQQNNEGVYGYYLNEVTEPRFNVKAAGTLLNLSSRTKEEPKQASSAPKNAGDLLLPGMYTQTLPQPAGLFAKSGTRSIKLSYTLSEEFLRTYDQQSSDEVKLYSLSKGSLLLSAIPDSRLLTSSFELTPQLTVSDDPKKTANFSQLFQLHSNTTIRLPFLGATYTLRQRLYRQEETRVPSLPSTVTIDRFSFDKSSVTTHQLSLDYSYLIQAITLKPSLSAQLWPLAQSLTPKLGIQYGGLSLTSSFRVTQEGEAGPLKKDLLTIGLGFEQGGVKTLTTYSHTFLHEPALSTLTHNLALTFLDGDLVISEKGIYTPHEGGVDHLIKDAQLSVKLPFLALTYSFGGPVSDLQSERFVGSLNFNEQTWRFYKRRAALSLGVNTTFEYDFEDPYASIFTIALKTRFQIAEFLDFTLSFASANTGFYHYQNDDGSFSWALLGQDLLRSFDFFGGGQRNTQFNLSSINAELIHYLADWTLNCKYTASVVLSNNQYHWVPTLSIYLTWNTIPDLDIEEKWSKPTTEWIRSL